MKLFEDSNFGGALAEFEAAYRVKPTASSLKNVALCQKAMFRYAEAAATLDDLLGRHGSEMSDADRADVKSTIDELRSLVGSVVLRVSPPGARVRIDERLLEASELSAGIALNVGEHALSAEAPGYKTVTRTLRVAGAQKDVAVDVVLEATMGFVSVSADLRDAAIAIDGSAKAFRRWYGPITPGRHYVQIYRYGYATIERVVSVSVGQTVEVTAKLGPRLTGEQAPPKQKKEPAPPQRGLYALAVLSGVNLQGNVEALPHDKSGESGGVSIGGRAGYRVWTPVAVEALLEFGRNNVRGACDELYQSEAGNEGKACDHEDVKRTYTVESFRAGPNLRLLSAGERLRVTATVGAGGVRHELRLEAKDAVRTGGTLRGIDPYFLLELGAQLNLRHLLLELDLSAFLDGTGRLNGAIEGRDRAYRGTGLLIAGLGLRAGWSEWLPPGK